MGDVKHSDLPGMEALGREGKKDGQVIMIKNKGAVEAYSVSQLHHAPSRQDLTFSVDGRDEYLAASRDRR